LIRLHLSWSLLKRFHVSFSSCRSSGRARIAELPSSHPIRREERQRQREREKRRGERDDRGGDRDSGREHHNNEHNNSAQNMSTRDAHPPRDVQDPRRQAYPSARSGDENKAAVVAPPKNASATEWHDPWMRTQTGPMVAGQKPGDAGKLGIEAVSDSSSSDSDSDSDSGLFFLFCFFQS